MTIRPGSEWGHHGSLPPGTPVVATDAEAAALVADWAAAGRPAGGVTVGLLGGDLHRTIGAPSAERMTTAAAMVLPCDVAVATIDGVERWFVAHLVAGDDPLNPRAWFRHRTSVVMNAAFIGLADLGPKAHPGDGRLDITTGALPSRDRRIARTRYGAGAHLPHPGLVTSRVAHAELTFDRPVSVALDGVSSGRARKIEIQVVPDVLTIIA